MLVNGEELVLTSDLRRTTGSENGSSNIRQQQLQGEILRKERYIVRRMSRQEVDLAVEWAFREGWNPGIHDADSFYSTDPEGFFLGVLDDEPVGSISAVAYSDSFGFLGLYIVRPQFRGKGYGTLLWEAAVHYLKGRNVGLDAVVENEEIYQRLGFNSAYHSYRYRGEGLGSSEDTPGIFNLTQSSMELLMSYDAPFFPAPRGGFLESWIGQRGSIALGLRRKARLQGYGVLRPCREGFKIGPLFANEPSSAEDLLRALMASAPVGEPVFLDVPQPNPAAEDLANDWGMEKVFETVRMYSREETKMPMNRIFGITSFELG